MSHTNLRKLASIVAVASALSAPYETQATEMCGGITTTGNALTLGKQECTSGNGLYFYVDIENNNTSLTIETSGGSGEADIFTNVGNWATRANNTHSTNTQGTAEILNISANAGRLYISLFGIHEQVSFKVSADNSNDDGDDDEQQLCGSITNTGGELTIDQPECTAGNGLYYYVNVAENDTELTVTTRGGTGEANIFINDTTWATNTRNIASSATNGTTEESITYIANSGYSYISVFGIHNQVELKVTAGDGSNDNDPATAPYIIFDKNIDVNIPAATIDSPDQFSDEVNQIINSTWNDWAAIASGTPDPLIDVANAIHFLAEQDDTNSAALDNLTYFLRNYAINGDYTNLSLSESKNLSNALVAFTKMTNFFTTDAPLGLLHENYATTLSNFAYEPASERYNEQLPHILALIQFYSELETPFEYENYGNSSHQILKSIYDLAYQAKTNVQLKTAFNENMLAVISVLRSWGLSSTSLDMRWQADSDRIWITRHLFIALANVADIAEAQAVKDRIDSIITEIFDHITDNVSAETAKLEITSNYLNNLNRTCDDSDALVNYCQNPPQIEDILTITYQCNDSVTIRAQAMTNAQLVNACDELAEVDTRFHNLFSTEGQPVADDYNSQLEVIVYASPADYEKYGYDFFDHSTDNGGIYLEGDPSVQGNVPRFHAMQCPASWVPYSCSSEGDVYNLAHEYVHYLDGRYNLYGAFSYHDNTVSWAEGLAEWIAKGADDQRSFDSIAGQEIPPLFSILFMDYNFANLYPWSYFTTQYFYEERNDALLSLAQKLRSSDKALYQAELQTVLDTDTGYTTWMLANTDTIAPPEQIIPADNTFGSCDLVYPYQRSDTPASVTVTNPTSTPVTLYWVDNTNGQANFDSPYATLQDGESYAADYWVNGDRIVIADNFKSCLGVAVMTATNNQLTVGNDLVKDAVSEENLPPANELGGCDLLNAYTRGSDGTTSISVTNTSNNAVRLYWINAITGEPNLSNNYQTLNNGDTYSADFWSNNDRMMLADSNDQCLGVAVLSEATNTYTISN